MTETREITIEIEGWLDDELHQVAESTGPDKAAIVRDVLIAWLEDQEDIREVERVIGQGNATISLDEIKQGLNL